MIQRIQSLFLLGAIVCFSIMHMLDLASFTTYDADYNLDIYGLSRAGGDKVTAKVVLSIMAAVIELFLAFVIFSYKDRKKQIRLCFVAIAFIVGLLLFMIMHFIQARDFVMEMYSDQMNPIIKYSLGFGMAMPTIAIVLVMLAIRGIRNDEELVRSADRIR